MTEDKKTRRAMETPIMRTFVRAPISSISRWKEVDDGVGFCRISVIGEAPGPASTPPRVTLYVQDGGDPKGADPLRPDEARRCVANLRPGDWIEAVGVVGPERETADHQEVIVTERVKLKERGPAWEMDEEDDQAGDLGEPYAAVLASGRPLVLGFGEMPGGRVAA